ncbi:flagellar filament capping protein FliD [Anaerovibrio lipolyticus]|uniref:flagellar filament capping protein FliD n=1 Tax=Anaerovibrio lipolyticus TaxID=82374 RepID=UPI001F321866|nr:flagellar filament capping protein FliD [Anaerovibrio lipolyticus]MCF2600600.1 flagellar filament capping protein FliD [Anaerovibrio lipolyticus]
MGANGIYGLSGSGLDIESLVKMGMMNKQNQYDKMYQTQLKQTWVKEAYNTVYTDVKAFKESMSTFKMQSNMSAMQATSSNNDVVSVTANGAAAAMNHKITVEQVASNAYLMTANGQKIDRANNSAANSAYLKDVLFSGDATKTTVDGQTSYLVKNDTTGKNDTFKGSDVAISIEVQDGDEVDSDGKPVTHKVEFTYDQIFGDNKTLNDLATAFSNSGANVQGGYDTVNDSFSLYNKTSGSANKIGLKANNEASAKLLNKLHLASYDGQNNTLGSAITFETDKMNVAATGTNAKATIDGKTYESDTNKLNVANVIYNFNGVSAKNADGTYQASTISVSQDTDKIVDNVKKFVETYNTLIDSLNTKYREEKNTDYKPLTKKQESEMTESQINKWNEKAKSGLLYHDNNIYSIISDMREALYTEVDAVDTVLTDARGNKYSYNSMSSIGITSSTNQGHITLDEEKLKKALTEDPDCVYQLFASDQDSTYISGSTNKNQSDTYTSKSDYLNTGIANRLYNSMTTNIRNLENYAGTSKETDDESYLGKLITNMNTKMTSFQTLMKSYESKLYKKYDAMEVALSKLGAQLSYITG